MLLVKVDDFKKYAGQEDPDERLLYMKQQQSRKR